MWSVRRVSFTPGSCQEDSNFPFRTCHNQKYQRKSIVDQEDQLKLNQLYICSLNGDYP